MEPAVALGNPPHVAKVKAYRAESGRWCAEMPQGPYRGFTVRGFGYTLDKAEAALRANLGIHAPRVIMLELTEA